MQVITYLIFEIQKWQITTKTDHCLFQETKMLSKKVIYIYIYSPHHNTGLQ